MEIFISSDTRSESVSILGGKTPENDTARIKRAWILHNKHAKKENVIEGSNKFIEG